MVIFEEKDDDPDKLTILDEMANLAKSDTGLPVIIWLDSSRTYLRGGHGKRIKFQNDYGNTTNRSNLISMTISKDDPQIPEKYRNRVKLPAKDIDAVKTFVRNNYSLLDKLADEKITLKMFFMKMRPN
jgi:hypothetical protein